jgi:hypothetical protein
MKPTPLTCQCDHLRRLVDRGDAARVGPLTGNWVGDVQYLNVAAWNIMQTWPAAF